MREARGAGAGILPDDESHPSRGGARAGGLVEPGRGADAFYLYSEFVKKSPNSVIPAKAGIQKEHVTPQPPHWIPAFGPVGLFGFVVIMVNTMCRWRIIAIDGRLATGTRWA